MTQEEFYIWLTNCDSGTFPEFNSEFLKNYEIAKLVLDKFSIHRLNENQQKILNPEAASAWLRNSRNIKLEYDILKISELLPERINFILDLENSQIQSLPQLESVKGGLFLQDSQIESLPQLESVGGSLYLGNSQIQSLPKLKSVGEGLYLTDSQIKSLPRLESVGGRIYTRPVELYCWRNYFDETERPHLADKVCY